MIGFALTEPDRDRDRVFEPVSNPPCRLTRLRPVSSAYASAQGALILSPKFVPRFKGFPVTATLLPGISLGPPEGLPHWKADTAVNGFLGGDAEYVEMAAQLLKQSTGFTLQLSSEVEALVVDERYFEAAVEIGEPEHFGPGIC